MKRLPIHIASCLLVLACNSADGQDEDLAPGPVSAPITQEPSTPQVEVAAPEQSVSESPVSSGGSGTSGEVPAPTSTPGGSGSGGSSSDSDAGVRNGAGAAQSEPDPPEGEFAPDLPPGYSAGSVGPPQAEGVRFVEFEVREGEQLVARIPNVVSMAGGIGRLLEGQPPGPMPELCFQALQYPPAGDRFENYEVSVIANLLGIAFRVSSAPESGTRFILIGNYNSTGEEWAFAGPGMKVALFQSGVFSGASPPSSDTWPNIINLLAWQAIPIESEVCISEIYVIVDDPQ